MDEKCVVQERFVFQMMLDVGQTADGDSTEAHAALRAFLLKISVSETILVPQACSSFRIAIDVNGQCSAETLDWVRAEEPPPSTGPPSAAAAPSAKVVVPIKSSAPYNIPGFAMQLWAEQLTVS
eukprot:EG_transcript_44262